MTNYFEACAVSALDLLDAWGKTQPPEVLQMLDELVECGAQAGLIVTTGADVPEVRIIVTNPHDDSITVVGRLTAIDRNSLQ